MWKPCLLVAVAFAVSSGAVDEIGNVGAPLNERPLLSRGYKGFDRFTRHQDNIDRGEAPVTLGCPDDRTEEVRCSEEQLARIPQKTATDQEAPVAVGSRRLDEAPVQSAPSPGSEQEAGSWRSRWGGNTYNTAGSFAPRVWLGGARASDSLAQDSPFGGDTRLPLGRRRLGDGKVSAGPDAEAGEVSDAAEGGGRRFEDGDADHFQFFKQQQEEEEGADRNSTQHNTTNRYDRYIDLWRGSNYGSLSWPVRLGRGSGSEDYSQGSPFGGGFAGRGRRMEEAASSFAAAHDPEVGGREPEVTPAHFPQPAPPGRH